VLLVLLASCADPAGTPPPAPIATVPDEPIHLVRLTHRQWENTVVELLGLRVPTGFSETFVADPQLSTFDDDRRALAVTPTLWQQYQMAAEAIAERVVADPVLYARNVPEDLRPDGPAPGERERDAWLAAFGQRACRQALDPQALTALAALFDRGPTLFASGDPFTDGVRASIAAILQSPCFLYRFEGVAGPAGAAELAQIELASKLSYALWNTLPDQELLDAAAAGELAPPFLDSQVQRMLEAPAAHDAMADLHRQLLHVDSYAQIWRPSEEVLGIDVFEDSTPAAMQSEVFAFVDDAIWNGGTVRDLFTSRRTFANQALADIYGISGIAGDDLVPVDLDPAQRSGLLTLSGFLAWEADQSEPKLIERGAFVNSALLCVDIPPPPANAAALPIDEDSDLTLRERIDNHTSTCGAGCHTALINPIGYAFGKYDQNGGYATRDQGSPIDATGTYTFEDGPISFDGAVELGAILAEREQVHRCYVGHLLAYLEGRAVTSDDEDRLEGLTAASLAGLPIRELVADIVTDPAFREVAP
jgi:hypothetical protein